MMQKHSKSGSYGSYSIFSTATPYTQSKHFAQGTNSQGGTIPVAQKITLVLYYHVYIHK